jgi:hypothetical protein
LSNCSGPGYGLKIISSTISVSRFDPAGWPFVTIWVQLVGGIIPTIVFLGRLVASTLSRSDLGARLIAPEVLRVLKVVEARVRRQTAKRLRARRFVFPSHRSRQRCMSESATNAALRRLGCARRK